MLNKNKNITLDAMSTIDGIEVEHYHASISLEGDTEPNYTSYIVNKALYRTNRATCQQDRAAFEDWMYAEADAMNAETSTEV